MLRSVNKLEKYHLHAKDGRIGRITDFFFDDSTWTLRYLVVDTGHWLLVNSVLLTPHSLGRIEEESDLLDVNLTKQQIEDSPPIETNQPVSRQYELYYYRHYGYPIYWEGPALWGATPYPVLYPDPKLAETTEPEGDPHLRSANSLRGYTLHAHDGNIGRVDDFLLDSETWQIRYLVVKLHHGRRVLISPDWIKSISWEDSTVQIDLNLEAISGAPPFNGPELVTREYEKNLHDYYERQAYWEREYPHEHHAKVR